MYKNRTVHNMKEKRPIDRTRDSAFKMEVGSGDDTSPITGMFAIAGCLHVFKENAIYKIALADDIDPKRANVAIPNTQQKVLGRGSNDPIVGRTILTAKELFNASYLPKDFDANDALRLAFALLKDLSAMQDMATAILEDQNVAIAALEDRRKEDRSIVMPALGNVDVRCKEFIQKADHVLQSLLSIAKLFYGRDAGRQWFESLRDIARHRYGQDDQLYKFLDSNLPLLKFVRNARNCVEHPDKSKHLRAKDFALASDGSLTMPTCEIVHPDSPLLAIPLTRFTADLTDRIVSLVEAMLVLMTDRHVQSVSGFPIQVVEFPEGHGPEKNVRYGLGFYQGDHAVRAS